MPLTAKETELRLRARVLIQEGLLPRRPPEKTWGGYGLGKVCSLCSQPIQQTDVEYEVQDDDIHAPGTYRFHFMCHAAWQFECARQDHLDRVADENAPMVDGSRSGPRGGN